ncbi:MAG: GlsB/YeaQ/YmgE family stress response membrane protein [Bacteroidales bacterium]|nr:GlsB/YeaQ/YmgE family stress response membrane protein [Bacteroidales bacterium]
MNFLWYILIGALAGFIAGKLTKGGGFGFWVNLLVGIVGGVLGGWIFSLLGIGGDSIIWDLIVSVIGAIVFLWILSLFKKKK